MCFTCSNLWYHFKILVKNQKRLLKFYWLLYFSQKITGFLKYFQILCVLYIPDLSSPSVNLRYIASVLCEKHGHAFVQNKVRTHPSQFFISLMTISPGEMVLCLPAKISNIPQTNPRNDDQDIRDMQAWLLLFKSLFVVKFIFFRHPRNLNSAKFCSFKILTFHNTIWNIEWIKLSKHLKVD